MSALRSSVRSSALVENVLSGTRDRADARGGQPADDERRAVRVQQPDVGARPGARRRAGPSPAPPTATPPRRTSAPRRRRSASGWSPRRAARSRSSAGTVSGRPSPASTTVARHGAVRRGETDGSRLRSPATASIVAVHSVLVAEEQPGARRDAALVGRRGRSRTRARTPSGVGRRYSTQQRRRLARHADVAVVVLDRRSRRTSRARHRARRRADLRTRSGTSPCPVARVPVDGDLVLGEARVVRADVARVVDVGPPVVGRVGAEPRASDRSDTRPASARSAAAQIVDELRAPPGRRCSSAWTSARDAPQQRRDVERLRRAARRRTSTAALASVTAPLRTARAPRRDRPCPTGCAAASSTSRTSSGSS